MVSDNKTFVVVPNWNGADFITACLESLQAQTLRPKILVVDNGSVDNSVELIKQRFPKVRLIELAANRGFAAGVNVGIRYALEYGAKAIALFNNDAVAEKDWLKNLVEALETNPKAGIVTGKFMRLDKKHIDSTGENYSVWGMPFPRGRNQKDHGQYDKPELVFGASGGASLYRGRLFQEVGLFDERFFAYFEDVDISFRAQLAGWQVVYEPGAVAYHQIGATTSRLGAFARYHSIKNFYMLYFKNMPGWLFFKYLPLFLLQSWRLGLSSALKGRLIAYLRGLGRFLLNLPYVINQRRLIQKKRSVSLRYISSLLYKRRPPKIPLI